MNNNVQKNRYEISKTLIDNIWNLKIKNYTYELMGDDGLVIEHLIPFPNESPLCILFDILNGRVSDFLVFETEGDKIEMFESMVRNLSILMEEQDRRHGSVSELYFKIESSSGSGFESKINNHIKVKKT